MATVNNNVLNYDKQIKYKGQAYLDKNIMPVESYAKLPKTTLVFDGAEIVVLKDEKHQNKETRYIKQGRNWVLKNTVINGDDVE